MVGNVILGVVLAHIIEALAIGFISFCIALAK